MEKLRELGICTLEERRHQQDMTQTLLDIRFYSQRVVDGWNKMPTDMKK
jgi:hypothetical protein